MITLETNGLVKRFGKMEALGCVSVSSRPGTVTALIGPNDAGKSTLVLVAAGLIAPDAGTVRADGFTAETRSAQRVRSLLPEQADLSDALSRRKDRHRVRRARHLTPAHMYWSRHWLKETP